MLAVPVRKGLLRLQRLAALTAEVWVATPVAHMVAVAAVAALTYVQYQVTSQRGWLSLAAVVAPVSIAPGTA